MPFCCDTYLLAYDAGVEPLDVEDHSAICSSRVASHKEHKKEHKKEKKRSRHKEHKERRGHRDDREHGGRDHAIGDSERERRFVDANEMEHHGDGGEDGRRRHDSDSDSDNEPRAPPKRRRHDSDDD